MSKKFPDFKSDEEADARLQGADLTEYDLSEMKTVRFELARKDASISLRLPAALLATLKAEAAKANMPTQRLIRMLLEAQLAKTGAKAKRKPARSGKRRRERGRTPPGAFPGLRKVLPVITNGYRNFGVTWQALVKLWIAERLERAA